MNRRLYRCAHDRRIAGVAAGVAEYLDVDVSLVRVAWFLSIFFGGFGLLLYVLMALVVPLEPETAGTAAWRTGDMTGVDVSTSADANADAGADAGIGAAPGSDVTPGAGAPTWGSRSWAAPHRHAGRGGPGIATTLIGGALVLFGGLAFLDQLLPAWADQGRFLWPAFVLGLGVLLLIASMRRPQPQP